jgi:ubiquitin carboxyl-terminal hydrolase 4/11/15
MHADKFLPVIPPIDAQIKTVTTIIEAAAEHQASEGDKMFLVSKRWLDRVTSRGSDAIKKSKTVPEGEIGPIDNSDIIQQIIKDCYGVEFVQLKNGLGVDDFTLFPQAAWDLVMEWYGLMKGSIPIERYAHNTNPDKNGIPNIQFEFHPCVFTLHRLYGENNTINIPQKLKVDNPPAPIFVVSRSMKYNEFLKKLKIKAEIDLSKKVRLWRVPRIQPAAEPVEPVANTATPPSSRPGSPAAGTAVGTTRQLQDSWTQLFLDVPSFVQLQRGDGRELIDIPDSTANAKYNGGLDLSTIGLGDDQTLVLEEQTTGDNFVSNHVSKGAKATSTALTRSGVHQSKSQPTSGRNSPAPSGPITRGRAQKSGRTIGTAGMSNLGNTCYMNSALQCVRSVEELTKYFLTGAAKSELNYENPLGNRGEVALAYERLLEEIYREQNPPISVTPRHFKTTIGKFAPSFSGYGQQDSQEFLGFLLDGLQEDLSRVKKKPYIEKPDSTDEMVGNPEAIREMAAKVWDITKKRDDSVIADLFTGMYKSTLVCPVCSKVSITFDPFNNLTLQLPIESSWSHQVFYFPLNDKPVIINVDIDKHASILSLKQFISSRVGVPVERLFAAEEFKSKFYKTYKDYKVASEEIQSNDQVAVYELEAKPTNWPPRLKSKQKKDSYLNNDSDEEDVPNWDDPIAERMLVPVFHRHVNPDRVQSRYHSRKPWVIKGAPHFIIVTPEEVKHQ